MCILEEAVEYGRLADPVVPHEDDADPHPLPVHGRYGVCSVGLLCSVSAVRLRLLAPPPPPLYCSETAAAPQYTSHTCCTLHPLTSHPHPAPYSLHPAPCTLKPCTWHPLSDRITPCSLHPLPCTLDPGTGVWAEDSPNLWRCFWAVFLSGVMTNLHCIALTLNCQKTKRNFQAEVFLAGAPLHCWQYNNNIQT